MKSFKKIRVKEIVDYLGSDLLESIGDITNTSIDNISDPENTNESTLDWVNSSKQGKQVIAENSLARVLVVDSDVFESEAIKEKQKTLLVVKNPRLCMAKIANHFFVNRFEAGIHPSATIDKEAKIHPSAHISAGCVVGKASIGADTILMPNVVIYDNVTIGEDCLFQAGVVIGTDGLGCTRDEKGKLTKFPHLGGVVIGNHVEIGANSQIAKGSFSDTVIENGCKMNGLCFIAHNCHLEENVWITGNTMLCGSVHVKKNSTIFSSVIIRDQRTIGEGVTVGMGSVVTKNIPDGEIWIGNPAKKFERD